MLKEKFYNPEYKKQFLQPLELKVQDGYAVIFNLSKNYEETYNKDLYAFTFNEYISLFGLTSGISQGTFYNYKSYIKKYVEYAIEHKLIPAETIDNIIRINYNDIMFEMRIDNLFYRNWQDCADTIVYVLNENDVDIPIINRALAFYGMLWFGIPKDKILTLTSANISKTTSCIVLDGRFHEVDASLIKVCQNAVCDVAYLSTNGRCRLFEDNDYIIKRDSSKTIQTYTVATFNRNFNINWNNYLNNLSYTSKYKSKKIVPSYIRMCGQFEKMQNYEKERSIKIDAIIDYQKYTADKHLMPVKNIPSYLQQYKLWQAFLRC